MPIYNLETLHCTGANFYLIMLAQLTIDSVNHLQNVKCNAGIVSDMTWYDMIWSGRSIKIFMFLPPLQFHLLHTWASLGLLRWKAPECASDILSCDCYGNWQWVSGRVSVSVVHSCGVCDIFFGGSDESVSVTFSDERRITEQLKTSSSLFTRALSAQSS